MTLNIGANELWDAIERITKIASFQISTSTIQNRMQSNSRAVELDWTSTL